jgi:hypothetical protein
MYRARSATAIILLSLAIAACTNSAPQTNSDDAASADKAAGTSGALLELGTAPATGEAFPLATGSVILGSFAAPTDGMLTSLAVQIGNYANSADGEFRLEACQAGQCSSGIAPLSGSRDNAYLEASLSEPLQIQGGEPVHYRIIRASGTGPAAIWLYPVAAGQAGIQVNEQTTIASVPRIGLRVAAR